MYMHNRFFERWLISLFFFYCIPFSGEEFQEYVKGSIQHSEFIGTNNANSAISVQVYYVFYLFLIYVDSRTIVLSRVDLRYW